MTDPHRARVEQQAVLLLDEINQYLGSNGGWEHCLKLLIDTLTAAAQAARAAERERCARSKLR